MGSDFKEYMIRQLDQMDDFYEKPQAEQSKIVEQWQNDHIDQQAEEADRLNDLAREQ